MQRGKASQAKGRKRAAEDPAEGEPVEKKVKAAAGEAKQKQPQQQKQQEKQQQQKPKPKGKKPDPEDEDLSGSDDSEDSDPGLTFEPRPAGQEDHEEEEEEKDEDEEEGNEGDDSESDKKTLENAEGAATNETVEVTFDISDFQSEDYGMVRALMRRYIDDDKWDLRGFADLIAEQAAVGSVVRADQGEGDRPALGFATVINLKQFESAPSIPQLKQYLLSKCSNPSDQTKLSTLLNHPQTGLLISERIINLAPELVPHLYRELMKDVDWAAKEADPASDRKHYQFQNLIVLARCFSLSAAPAGRIGAGGGGKKKKKAATKQKQAAAASSANLDPTALSYLRFEDDVFRKASTMSLAFGTKVGESATETERLTSARVLMVIPAAKFPKLIDSLDRLMQELADEEAAGDRSVQRS